MEYSIGEFSKLTRLGIHTLRYYEHENLITPGRNSSNRRCYTDKDLAWIDFIKRLKDTGMPNELPRSRAAGYLKGRSITYNPINSTVLALVRFDRVSYTLFLDLVLLRILISLLHFHAPLP